MFHEEHEVRFSIMGYKIVLASTLILLFQTTYANDSKASLSEKFGPSVPFVNVALNRNQVMFSNYNFGGFSQLLCYTVDFGPDGLVSYTYKGFPTTVQLPVILKTNNNVEGNLADPLGVIRIQNTSTNIIYVSCQFGF